MHFKNLRAAKDNEPLKIRVFIRLTKLKIIIDEKNEKCKASWLEMKDCHFSTLLLTSGL